MLKHVSEVSKKLHKCNVYVKSFPGAKVRWMKDYAKSCKPKP